MRTLTFVGALLLLVFQAQAETLQEAADQLPTQDQLGPEDQNQPGTEDEDMAISFTQDASGVRKTIFCTCRRTLFCPVFESLSGSCQISGRRYKLCCR